MQERGFVLDDYTLLMENRSAGNYRVLKWPQGPVPVQPYFPIKM